MRGNTAIRWSWTRRIRKTRRRRCSTGALLWISPRRWWMLITPNQASRLLRYRLLLQPQHPSRARLTDRRRTEARITRDGLVLKRRGRLLQIHLRGAMVATIPGQGFIDA